MSYGAIAIKAAAALAKKGQTVTLRKITVGTYSAGAVHNSKLDYERNGLFLDYGLIGSGKTHSGGVLIEQGDKQLYMEAGIVPELKDRVLIGEVEYGIANIKELSPGGVVIMYELHLRRS